ncbi:MAG TPA: VOC family protein, partial [Candidatus Limnocylindria bacterium]|nr:VOC family protein [Candidatus Limnocylindria bacterium]
ERECAALAARGVVFAHEVESYDFGRFNEFWDPENRLISLLEPPQPFVPGTGLALSTVILNAEEFSRTAGYYRDQLGLPIAEQREHWVEFDTGPTRVAVHSRRASATPLHASPPIAFAFEVGDLDVFAETLRQRGAQFATTPAEEAFGVYAEILDPDGNVVVFRQSLPPPSREEELAEGFEDDAAPARTSIRKSVKKGSKAVSRVAVRPGYRTSRSTARKRPSGTTQRVASVRGAGPERSRQTPKRTADEKKARGKPAIGRAKKATRATLAQKKRAVARASKGRVPKRSAGARKR